MSLFTYEPKDRSGQDKVRVLSLHCPVLGCGQVFSNPSQDDNHAVREALKQHVAVHQLYDLMCYHITCSQPYITNRNRIRSFEDQVEMNSHDRAHQLADSRQPIRVPNKYKCPLCPYRGIMRSDVTLHFRRNHTLGHFGCKNCALVSYQQSAIIDKHYQP